MPDYVECPWPDCGWKFYSDDSETRRRVMNVHLAYHHDEVSHV